MSDQKDHELTGTLGRVYKAVLQSRTGIRAVEIADKLSLHKSTVYAHLNSLKLRGFVKIDQGVWTAKKEQRTTNMLEKEIVIELPISKAEYQRIAFLEIQAKEFERLNSPLLAEDIRTLLEKLRETRTIRIRGKNVDDLDLEKLGNLIQQANQKASKINLKDLFKSLKKSHANNSQKE